MTITNSNAAELNETQLDQVVGAGGLIIDRRATADTSDVIVHQRGGGAPASDIIVHDRSGK